MDTTAKVDIRRLQLLNDRIAQTIDALNQVRLSVHGLGLSHTTGPVASQGYNAFGAIPFQGVPQAWPGVMPGLQHTSPYGYAHHHVNPVLAQLWGQNPYVGSLLAQQGIGAVAGGLSHTSPEAWGAGHGYGVGAQIDPFTATRIMNLFPFAQMPVSPML